MRSTKQDEALKSLVEEFWSATKEGEERPRILLEDISITLSYIHELEEKVKEQRARENLYLDSLAGTPLYVGVKDES